jgi:tetratricopeptide (TPR) repeat protein
MEWSAPRALAEVEKIRRLDPVYPFTFLDESGVYYHQRDYKSLVEAGQKSVALVESLLACSWLRGLTRRLAEAVLEYQRAVELSTARLGCNRGTCNGWMAEAEKILGELQRQSKVTYISPYMIAVIYSGLGQREKAFEFLEKAYEERSPDVAYFVKADLRIDPLRSDQRFRDLMHRIGLPQ